MGVLAAGCAGPWSTGVAETPAAIEGIRTAEGVQAAHAVTPGLVRYPIEADIDGMGNLYVTESSGSNEKVEIQLRDRPHRVLRLTDTDGDGVYDARTVFADGMMLPEGALWHRGSLYVSAPPAIWKLTDTDGDGIADHREKWFDGLTLTGCANDLHGPYLGPDGWIYWCKGAFAGQVHELTDGRTFESRAAHVFRRRPEGGAVEVVMTGGMDNPVGLAFLHSGERFISTTFFQHPDNGRRDGLIHIIYGGVYGKQHGVIDGHPRTGPLMPVMTHLGPAAPAGIAMIPQGTALTGEYPALLSSQFNLRRIGIHHLIPDGPSFTTRDSVLMESDDFDFHPTDVLVDRDGSIIVVDTGGWYQLCCPTSSLRENVRPGSIYRLTVTGSSSRSMAGGSGRPLPQPFTGLDSTIPSVREKAIRQIVNSRLHPVEIQQRFEDIPKAQRTEDVLTGFIWAMTRIQHPMARGISREFIGHDSPPVSVAAIHSASVWRDASSREALLSALRTESPAVTRAALEALGRVIEPDDVRAIQEILSVLGRVGDRITHHSALYALIEIQQRGGVSPILADLVASSTEWETVGHALESIIESGHAGELSPEAMTRIAAIAPATHLQAAGGIIAKLVPESILARTVLPGRLSSSSTDADERAAMLVLLQSNASRPGVTQWVDGTLRSPETTAEEIHLLVRLLKDVPSEALTETIWESLMVLMDRAAASGDQLLLGSLVEVCREHRLAERPIVVDKTVLRLAAQLQAGTETSGFIRLLAAISSIPFDRNPALFQSFLMNSQSCLEADPEDFLTVLSAARFNGPQLDASSRILSGLGFMQRRHYWAMLANHRQLMSPPPESLIGALSALESLTPAETESLLALIPGEAASAVKEKLKSSQPVSTYTADDLNRMLESLPEGNPDRGRNLFHSPRAACIQCHEIGYVGGDVGPDLTRIGQIRTRRDLLESIVAPSLTMVRSFEPVMIETTTGDVHHAILRSQGNDALMLVDASGGRITVSMDQVATVDPSGVSLMPPGYGQILSKAEIADIIAYLKRD